MALQIGDLYLELDGNVMGFSGTLTAWVTARGAVAITAAGDTLGLSVLGTPSFELEVVAATGTLGRFVATLPSLLETIILPLIIDGIADLLGAIPIPAIDLSALVPGLPPGAVLRLGRLHATTDFGYVMLGGALVGR